MTYKWTTEKGAKIELTVVKETVQETIDTDWGVTRNKQVNTITRLTINNKAHNARFGMVNLQ